MVPSTFLLLIRYGSLFAMTSSRATNTEAINVDRRGNQSDKEFAWVGVEEKTSLFVYYLFTFNFGVFEKRNLGTLTRKIFRDTRREPSF